MKVYLRPINPADIKTLSLTYPGAPLAVTFGSCSQESKRLEAPVLVSRQRAREPHISSCAWRGGALTLPHSIASLMAADRSSQL